MQGLSPDDPPDNPIPVCSSVGGRKSGLFPPKSCGQRGFPEPEHEHSAPTEKDMVGRFGKEANERDHPLNIKQDLNFSLNWQALYYGPAVGR